MHDQEMNKEKRSGSLRWMLDRREISLYASGPIRRKRMGKKESACSVRNDGKAVAARRRVMTVRRYPYPSSKNWWRSRTCPRISMNAFRACGDFQKWDEAIA